MTAIYLTTLNLTDSSAILSVDGERYEYFFHSREMLRKLDIVARKSGAKALNFAKRNATRSIKLGAVQ